MFDNTCCDFFMVSSLAAGANRDAVLQHLETQERTLLQEKWLCLGFDDEP